MSRHRLNPAMEEGLRAMLRGPLEKTPGGWVATVGAIDFRGNALNSHTVEYMKAQGWVSILQGRAHIRPAGRTMLAIQDQYEDMAV